MVCKSAEPVWRSTVADLLKLPHLFLLKLYIFFYEIKDFGAASYMQIPLCLMAWWVCSYLRLWHLKPFPHQNFIWWNKSPATSLGKKTSLISYLSVHLTMYEIQAYWTLYIWWSKSSAASLGKRSDQFPFYMYTEIMFRSYHLLQSFYGLVAARLLLKSLMALSWNEFTSESLICRKMHSTTRGRWLWKWSSKYTFFLSTQSDKSKV